MDGVSLEVLVTDLEKAYNGQHLGPPPRQYPEFSTAQRQAYDQGRMDKMLEYWREVFPCTDKPPVLPLLPMARTGSRTPMTTFDAHEVQGFVEAHVAARIRRISQANASTPFHFFLTVFKTMLFRLADTDDLSIGLADAARNDDTIVNSIGLFLNFLPLRFRHQPAQVFTDALVEARSMTHAAQENSFVPFDVLLGEIGVDRSSTHSPFFQALFDYRPSVQVRRSFGSCVLEMQQDVHAGYTAYDISVNVTNTEDVTVVCFQAQTSIYDLNATRLLLDTYMNLLDIISTDPLLPLGSTPLFSETQLAHAIKVGHGPRLISEWPETLPLRIDQVARENPDKIALMDGTGRSLTYSAMVDRIEAIAEALTTVPGICGRRVLVVQRPSCDWPCTMLAVGRVGAVYVPLDSRNPMSRSAAVAQECEPVAIIADAATVNRASHLGVPKARVIDVSKIASAASTQIPNLSRAEEPATVLFTSGSTGKPKGIVLTHAGQRNQVEGYTTTWRLGAERVLQQSAVTFDISLDQIYTGLVNGGMVYIVPWDKLGSPLDITDLIHQHGITYTIAAPCEYLAWMQYGRENLRLAAASTWRIAVSGGEALTTAVTQEFADLGAPELRLFNDYGPAEITFSSNRGEVFYRERNTLERMAGRIPCGPSLPNYRTYIVDEQLGLLPVGMRGEICIGGAGVSRGYLDANMDEDDTSNGVKNSNDNNTNKGFVTNPFANSEDIANGWTNMYCTGDMGHLDQDGFVVFHNRREGDTQVKIRGLRVELGDIESNLVLAAGGALRSAVVTLRIGDPEFLVAHVTFTASHDITDREAFLEQLLSHLPVPQHMVPVVAIPLDELPLTRHAKIDRKALLTLPLPKKNKEKSEARAAEQLSETMIRLKNLWQEVLGDRIKDLGLDMTPSTSFFLVGGNSLLMVRLQARIRDIFHVAMSLVDLLGANTLGKMAHQIEEAHNISLINWDDETLPPVVKPSQSHVSASNTVSRSHRGKVVLITGATGALGKHLLPILAKRPEVDVIHCLAVRDLTKLHGLPPNIIPHLGDLTSPHFGLSAADFRTLAAATHVILHFGAARSFWDNYDVLRPVNVHPTREMVKLAASRRVPIHYISTLGTLFGAGDAAVSASVHEPPRDGTGGYVASRWVSERILERSASQLGVPANIYRFLPALPHPAPKAALDELVRVIDVTGKVPDLRGWTGRLDMIAVEELTQWLCNEVLSKTGPVLDPPRFEHYRSGVSISGPELAACLKRHRRGRDNLEEIPMLEWVGRIKSAGFRYFFSSYSFSISGVENGLDTTVELQR